MTFLTIVIQTWWIRDDYFVLKKRVPPDLSEAAEAIAALAGLSVLAGAAPAATFFGGVALGLYECLGTPRMRATEQG